MRRSHIKFLGYFDGLGLTKYNFTLLVALRQTDRLNKGTLEHSFSLVWFNFLQVCSSLYVTKEIVFILLLNLIIIYFLRHGFLENLVLK